MLKTKHNFEGIAVYTIERDGCLNGVYSNTGLPLDELYNEVARKDPNQPDGIEGVYTCTWIDENNKIEKGKLTITKKKDHYSVIWNSKKKDMYEGTGFLMGNNMFAVHYTTV